MITGPASSAWMPAMSCMNHGSIPSMFGGRSMIRPNAPARPSESARAALLGWKPISSAMARMRSRVAAETPGWPLSANDTAALVTPARRAMSAMVGRFTRCLPAIAGRPGVPARYRSAVTTPCGNAFRYPRRGTCLPREPADRRITAARLLRRPV